MFNIVVDFIYNFHKIPLFTRYLIVYKRVSFFLPGITAAWTYLGPHWERSGSFFLPSAWLLFLNDFYVHFSARGRTTRRATSLPPLCGIYAYNFLHNFVPGFSFHSLLCISASFPLLPCLFVASCLCFIDFLSFFSFISISIPGFYFFSCVCFFVCLRPAGRPVLQCNRRQPAGHYNSSPLFRDHCPLNSAALFPRPSFPYFFHPLHPYGFLYKAMAARPFVLPAEIPMHWLCFWFRFWPGPLHSIDFLCLRHQRRRKKSLAKGARGMEMKMATGIGYGGRGPSRSSSA